MKTFIFKQQEMQWFSLNVLNHQGAALCLLLIMFDSSDSLDSTDEFHTLLNASPQLHIYWLIPESLRNEKPVVIL